MKPPAMTPMSDKMKASILRIPNFWIASSRNVSNKVTAHPQSKGSPKSRFKPRTVPSTSARSVAAMAISHMIQSAKEAAFEYSDRQACAKSFPVTIPRRAANDCKSTAIMFDIRITQMSA